MSMRNSSNVKVALDSKAARFNVKKRELHNNMAKSKNFERTVRTPHPPIFINLTETAQPIQES